MVTRTEPDFTAWANNITDREELAEALSQAYDQGYSAGYMDITQEPGLKDCENALRETYA